MSDLNVDIQTIMAEVAERLKKGHPELEFFFVMCPFEKHQMAHLATEQRRELEKRVVSAATTAFSRYLKHPEELKV